MQVGDLNAIAFSPVGNWLAAANSIWDVESMQVAHTFGAGSREPIHAAFSPDGSILAIALFNQPITLWNIASEQVVSRLEQPDDTPIFGIEFSPDGSLLAAGHSYGNVRIWDIASGQVIRTLEYGNDGTDVHDIAFSPDSLHLAAWWPRRAATGRSNCGMLPMDGG
jgi:WD40 repeat protein